MDDTVERLGHWHPPTGIPISTKRGEKWFGPRLAWKWGFGLHRVWFGDHRSGWSGLNFHIYLFAWEWRYCIIRWRTERKQVQPVYTLREQIDDTHNATKLMDARLDRMEQESAEDAQSLYEHVIEQIRAKDRHSDL
jgi:hypothetical protein